MTANPSRNPSLDEVLEAIAAMPEPPNSAGLRMWIDQYPQFKAEIIDFSTDWVEMDAAQAPYEVTEDGVSLVVNRTMSRVQQELDAARRETSITDLSAEIRAAEYDADSFQRAIGVDHSIFGCLLDRLVRPATIPFVLIEAIAERLHRGPDSVRAYFRLSPRLQGVYKSRKKPAARQVDFAEVLATADLSEADRARWRAEAPDPRLQE